MKTIYWNDDYAGFCPSVATVGFFDGVHRGHKHLIKSVKTVAASMPYTQTTVFTFDTHPRMTVDKNFCPELLSTTGERLALLSKTGINNCIVLHFDKNMAAMSAQQFMKEVLHDRYNVKTLVTGYDHRFGHNRTETTDDYVRYGRETGIDVVKADRLTDDGQDISSSAVRRLIAGGDMTNAGICLGYNYFITGKVTEGFREGRKIGFPTANIKVNDSMKLIPKHGVYAVNVILEGTDKRMEGMMNIGNRPTFGGSETSLEVNIFDFSDDIYGHAVSIEFVSRLRDEHKFNSVDELTAHLKKDRETAKNILSNNDNLQFSI